MKIQLDKLMTEQQNPDTMSIDRMNSFEIVKAINNEDKKIALAVEKELASIAELVDACAERLSKGGRILYTGAGTSGRLGILDASECPPTYGVSDQLVQGLIADGLEAIFKSKENAEDDREAGIEDLKSINLCEKDVVIGLAASGRTPYVAAGLEYANSINAYTGSISCVKNSEIGKIAKTAIDVETGPEVVTGSTRMKAGTAQKMVLNMISTGTMIRLGKVFNNLMVDIQPTNAKLIERSKRILMLATGCDYSRAETLIETSNHDVKAAICMELSGLSLDECQKLLAENGGNISELLHQLQK